MGLLLLAVSAVAATGVVWWRAGPTPVAPPVPPTPVRAAPVVVHVAGAVGSARVVEVPAGSRVADAVAAAGGPLPDADLAGLNLARILEDGERIVVPRIAASGPRGDPGARPAPRVPGEPGGDDAGDAVVDLNRAEATALETLPGIGPVLAQRIVDWRERHGPFREVGQLREISGIGERTFQGLVDRVSVG